MPIGYSTPDSVERDAPDMRRSRDILAEVVSEWIGFPVSREFMQSVDQIVTLLHERGFKIVEVDGE
jgi:hypothetical protein